MGLGSSVPGLAVEVTVPTEPLSMPKGKTAELSCRYSTSVGDNFALEWSFVQPGKPISASLPVSRGQLSLLGWPGTENSPRMKGGKGVYLLGLQLVWPYVLPSVRNHSYCVQFP